ncbi:CTP synthase [Candidatus Saccharibacteria bacterium]|nr:CTP synthase [Candidatus Saccharibacteria bacterium]
MENTKYIFVTGGVLSGVGKGITAASIGAVLQSQGVKVSIQKCDPYLNVDAGLLNPKEHGECFVTKDGAETDLDLGHYERFLNLELTQKNATLSGKLLSQLIADERAGKFGGRTVQLVPHLTGAIQDAIELAADGQVHIVEIGGTVGDYEGLSFVEAIREFSMRVGRENCMYVHVVYVPFISTSKEFKTKPAQNALNDLRGFGITPDCVVVRTDEPAPHSTAEKIASFSGVASDGVILLPNARTVYEVPLSIASSGIHKVLQRFLPIGEAVPEMKSWRELVSHVHAENTPIVNVGVVAKYLDNEDTYISVLEALKAAAWHDKLQVNIVWINAETAAEEDFAAVDALVVPGGFGERGVEGKIAAARYALTHNKPYLGICLGLQVAVIAAARMSGLEQANSSEFNPNTPHNVIYIMEGQAGKESTGGTLRLGDYPAVAVAGSLVEQLYGSLHITERHRHRYEVNRQFEAAFNSGGLIVSGTSPDGKLVEFVEAKNQNFFVATQAHPEFRSRPHNPHPLFVGLIRATEAAQAGTR